MTTETYRGVVRGGMVVIQDKSMSLTEGAEVIVTPVGRPGTSAAVIVALESSPQVPAAWVDELEQLIAEGQRPPKHIDPFQ